MSVTPIKSVPAEPAAPAPARAAVGKRDLRDPQLYLNRELTWLAFNRRVLAEAEDDHNPLLERVKFLAIFDSNLDEFFMKRIGGLKHLARAGLASPTIDGRTPQEQISQCEDRVAEALQDRAQVIQQLLRLLHTEGIRVESFKDLDSAARAALRKRYRTSVVPLITPLAIDEAHPFPFVSNMSINLLLQVHDETEDEPHLIRIKVPVSDRTPRFMRIGKEDRFVPLEEVIAGNLDMLLPGAKILSTGFFRVTRNAIVERDEESANDLLEMIEAELRERRFAPVVRLEISPNFSHELRDYLAKELSLSHREDIYTVPDLLGARDLMQIAGMDRADLKFPRFEPAAHPRLANTQSIFNELDTRGPILLKHPYQSFDNSVTRLLREAVNDPLVLAIKTTVYRTSQDSAIVPLLVEAVTRGKQVAVVVELQARFDEAANIRWANRLEEAGIHVSYGVVGYKTHAKITLIVRQKPSGKLRRYVHLGTGNYHSVTARQYCDVGLMISDKHIGADTSELFNLLTSGSLSRRRYQELLVSPLGMKRSLIKKIRRETIFHRKSGNGHIQLKTNALEDADITRELYKATQAGVRVDLIVRDSCRLRPGLSGISESARVISILGRFLEHSRIYYFRNDGNEEYYIGSADLMTRNLVSRVEALVPIKDLELQKELREILDLQVNDTVGAWEMNSEGVYRRLSRTDGAVHSQVAQVELNAKRASMPLAD